jgi:transcriptional regulator with XRE-family HTH domain
MRNEDWNSMTDNSLMKSIGEYIKESRLAQNRTQSQVANDANISRSTLSLLERGEAVSVVTLLQVLRVLDLLHVMNSFKFEREISPIEYARIQQKTRKRARPKILTTDIIEDLGW